MNDEFFTNIQHDPLTSVGAVVLMILIASCFFVFLGILVHFFTEDHNLRLRLIQVCSETRSEQTLSECVSSTYSALSEI